MIQDATTQVQLSSSCSSLNGLLSVMRDATVESKFNVANKLTSYNANGIESANILVQNIRQFNENIDSFEQFYTELSHMYPTVLKSEYFTELYETTRFILGYRFASAPDIYASNITSGIRTSQLNSNIVLMLNFVGALVTQNRIDSFLQSYVIFYSDASTRDLQKKL
jgi:hypothetical protein